MILSASYDPADNKLRLRASSRLDQETYARVKTAGFRWAPKQDLFVAPMWTPEREDLLLELCGEIGDEDTSLVERAAERAERFEGYEESRRSDAAGARAAVSRIADNIPMGQPLLVGHHSERHARKDAERIENGMRRAIRMWDTADYWQRRAKGALAHARYRELPGVRHRRIKGLESDLRKVTKTRDQAEAGIKLWSKVTTLARAKAIANFDHISRCFTLAEYPRKDDTVSKYEGKTSLWSALDDGIIDHEQARAIAIPAHERSLKSCARWLAHFENRLAYERAMLAEDGGLPAERFDLQPGGEVLVRREWVTILRVNRSGGAAVSVTVAHPSGFRGKVTAGIEHVQDYRPPTEEAKTKVKRATSLAPLCNYELPGCERMTAAEWKEKSRYDSWRVVRVEATAEHGPHRHRRRWGMKADTHVFLTDAKRVDAPPAAKPDAEEPVTFEHKPAAPAPARPSAIAAPAVPADIANMRSALREGVKVVSAPQLFPTPPDLADRMVALAGIQPGHIVLEPSAGTGNLLAAMKRADKLSLASGVETWAIEINAALARDLARRFQDVRVLDADFLTHAEGADFKPAGPGYDKILMNPPFERGADILHIQHALSLLRPGGRLVALCANGPRQTAELRTRVDERRGTWGPLPEGTFKTAGTSVRAVLLVIDKEREA